jgi:hypothetical protein
MWTWNRIWSILRPSSDPAEALSVKEPRVTQWLTFRRRFTSSELAFCFGLLFWLAVACGVVTAWRVKVKPVGRPSAWWFSVAVGFFLLALAIQTGWIESVPKAVVVGDPIEVRFSPQATGTITFTCPEGTVVRVLGQGFGWVQIRRGDGRAGWVPEGSVKLL